MARSIFDLAKDISIDESENEDSKTIENEESRSIFDLIDELDAYENKSQSNEPFYKSYPKALAKGLLEGLHNFGMALAPQGEAIFNPQGVSEEFTDQLEELFPSEKTFGTKALRRGAKIVPLAIASPGIGATEAIGRSAIAGVLGEGAKEAGAPDWLQSIAELPAFLTPKLGKNVVAKGSDNQKLLRAARKFGLTEEEITPLFQGQTKQKLLSKAALRRGRTQKVLKETREGLGRVYSELRLRPEAQSELSQPQFQQFIEDIAPDLFETPANVRNLIREDFRDLISAPITPDSLMNFWKDINANMKGQGQQLLRLKKHIAKAIGNISPELAEDFIITNNLYSRYAEINKALKPNLVSDLMSASQGIKLMTGVALGNYPLLIEVAGEQGAKILAREALINPRLQNLSGKFIKAAKSGSIPALKKAFEAYKEAIGEINPEYKKLLDETDINQVDFAKKKKS